MLRVATILAQFRSPGHPGAVQVPVWVAVLLLIGVAAAAYLFWKWRKDS